MPAFEGVVFRDYSPSSYEEDPKILLEGCPRAEQVRVLP